MKQLSSLALVMGCTTIDKTEHETLLALLNQGTSSSDTAKDTSSHSEETGTPSEGFNSHFINFTESDQFIHFGEIDALSTVLDWTHDWSISFYLPQDLSSTDAALTLMRNGENWLGLSPNEEGFDLYLSNQGDSDNNIIVAEFFESLDGNSRITITHNAADSAILLYINGNSLTDDAVQSPQSNGTVGEVSVGQATGTSRAQNWTSGLDNMFVTNNTLSRSEVGFAASDDDISQYVWYEQVVGWWLMGEDSFPTVQDRKYGNHGSFENGVEDNFVSY